MPKNVGEEIKSNGDVKKTLLCTPLRTLGALTDSIPELQMVMSTSSWRNAGFVCPIHGKVSDRRVLTAEKGSAGYCIWLQQPRTPIESAISGNFPNPSGKKTQTGLSTQSTKHT